MNRPAYSLLLIFILTAWTAWTPAPLSAATINVDSVSGDVIPDNSECTLNEAVTNANADNDTASGADCAAGSGADNHRAPGGHDLSASGLRQQPHRVRNHHRGQRLDRRDQPRASVLP
ncbi:MAG: hypothetical protein GY720_00505, partial [bacterium]|nr:hypothetical protein [bacterium]